MRTRVVLPMALVLSLAMGWGVASAGEPGLEPGFLNPPASARPWVYWFWLNSNITREGITADLEAMKESGPQLWRGRRASDPSRGLSGP